MKWQEYIHTDSAILALRRAGYDVAAIAEDSPGIPDKMVLQRGHDEPAPQIVELIEAGDIHIIGMFTVLDRDHLRQRRLSRDAI